MKNKYILFVILISSLFVGSCKKFLKESSQDEIRPTTTQDLYSLMIGSAYPYTTSSDYYLDLLTDELKSNGLTNNTNYSATFLPILNNGTYLYTWNPAMFDRTSAGLLSDQDSWSYYYKLINGCNLVQDYVDKVTGTQADKNAMLGQVLFLRAYYYFKLVNIYAQPYNGAGADPTTSLGVPLILSSVVSDIREPRNTVAEVYNQIEKDLLKAADLLKNNYTQPNTFRVGWLPAYALLSRVYLYRNRTGDMDSVIKYASSVIAEKPTLTTLTSYFNASGTFSTNGIYDVNLSQEVLWQYGNNPINIATYIPAYSSFLNAVPPLTISDSLLNLYDRGTDSTNKGDLRYTSYFLTYINSGVKYPLRSGKVGSSTTPQYGDKGIRTAEVYLNRAEALIKRYKTAGQSSDLTQALSDINTLRLSRYDTRKVAYVPVAITNADSLFSFLKQERRRELCLEDGLRWFDIKRWGEPITHTYIDASGVSTTYALPSGSLIYALPIPYTALDNNYNLVQNKR